jgi:hypothetical protein
MTIFIIMGCVALSVPVYLWFVFRGFYRACDPDAIRQPGVRR